MKKYEITFLSTGKTVVWTETKAKEVFGEKEWIEFAGNYLPHVCVTQV